MKKNINLNLSPLEVAAVIGATNNMKVDYCCTKCEKEDFGGKDCTKSKAVNFVSYITQVECIGLILFKNKVFDEYNRMSNVHICGFVDLEGPTKIKKYMEDYKKNNNPLIVINRFIEFRNEYIEFENKNRGKIK